MQWSLVAMTAVVAPAAGACVAGLAVMWLARRAMVLEHKSRYGFEETVKRLQEAIEKADGWGSPIPEWRLSDVIAQKGTPLRNVARVTLVYACKGPYAREVIDANPSFASIMPCGWAVYEKSGSTYLGMMNIAMMSMPFKGVVRETFRAVGREEEEILRDIVE